jgi:hypothetical protein
VGRRARNSNVTLDDTHGGSASRTVAGPQPPPILLPSRRPPERRLAKSCILGTSASRFKRRTVRAAFEPADEARARAVTLSKPTAWSYRGAVQKFESCATHGQENGDPKFRESGFPL